MSRRLVPLALVLVALALAAFAAACGDGPDQVSTPTKAASQKSPGLGNSGAATEPPWPGPAPRLGTYVTAITPAHGASVAQTDTRTTDPTRPRGVCFEANFKDLPESAQWFRMAVDDQEVTVTDFTWVVSSNEQPEGGRGCFAPPAGLKLGRHTAAVSVQNPSNPNEPTRELVSWAFEVVAQ